MTHVFRDRDFLVGEIAQLKAEIGQWPSERIGFQKNSKTL